MEQVIDENRCFACGKKNPIGLKLDFGISGEFTVSSINFGRNYEGWKGVIHGGLVSTVLDEIMVKAASNSGFTCVTAELNVRHKKPCLSGKEYELRGKVSEVRRNIILTEGAIIDSDGKTIASGSGKMFVIDPEKHKEI